MSVTRYMAWCAWVAASVFYAYQYVLRVMPSIMLTDILQKFHIDAALFGQFSGIYYIGYAFMHLPIGIMLDRFGPKKVMTGCILLTVLGITPLVFSDHWICAVLGRALTGIGSSAAILGTFKIIRMMFPPKHFSRMLGFSVPIGLVGAIYGEGPLSVLNQWWGSQVVVLILLGVGVLLAAVTYWIVPAIQPERHASVWANMKTILTHKKVMCLCFFSALMVGPLEGFADIWGAIFLREVYHVHQMMANYLPSMIFIGMCFGAPILSLLAEKTGYYLGVIMSAGVLMCLTFTLLLAGLLTVNGMSIGFFLIGVCCAYQILAIYKASTYVPDNLSGLTTAVANMIIMSFGYGFHSAIGFVVTTHGGVHSPLALSYGVGVIPVALALGVIGLAGIALYERCCMRSSQRI